MAEFKKGTGADQLPQGAATQLNELPDPTQADTSNLYPPGFQDLGESLLGPTDRPNEPISHGMPFGEGPNTTSSKLQPDEVRRKVLAQKLLSDPNASKLTREFAARLAQGD